MVPVIDLLCETIFYSSLCLSNQLFLVSLYLGQVLRNQLGGCIRVDLRFKITLKPIRAQARCNRSTLIISDGPVIQVRSVARSGNFSLAINFNELHLPGNDTTITISFGASIL